MNTDSISDTDLRPVCFMVMPFGRKQVGNARVGAPTEVDFDLLRGRAFSPAIDALGYTPVRADAAGIIVEQDASLRAQRKANLLTAFDIAERFRNLSETKRFADQIENMRDAIETDSFS